MGSRVSSQSLLPGNSWRISLVRCAYSSGLVQVTPPRVTEPVSLVPEDGRATRNILNATLLCNRNGAGAELQNYGTPVN